MLKRLHKIIGLSIGVIVVHLAITGILLMYPYSFRLTETYFTNDYLYYLYDMHTPSDVRVLEDSEAIGLIGSKIIVSDSVIETNLENIISFLKKDNHIFLVNSNTVLVIEENDFEARVYKSKKFEFSLYSIGFSNYQVAIKDVDNNIFIMDQNFDFIKSNDNTIDYVESQLVTPSLELSQYFLNQVQGPGIQALRFVADLHNGRFFGPIVMMIFFISSFLIIFLAISGFYITIRPKVKRYFYKKKNSSKF